jgi:hypothetical protein
LKPLLADCLHALAVAVGYDNSSSGSGGGSGGRAGAAAAPAMLGGGGGGGEAQQRIVGGPGGAASAASAAAHTTPTAALLEANMFFFLRTWFLQRPEDPEALLRCLPWELCGEASVSAFARRHAAIIVPTITLMDASDEKRRYETLEAFAAVAAGGHSPARAMGGAAAHSAESIAERFYAPVRWRTFCLFLLVLSRYSSTCSRLTPQLVDALASVLVCQTMIAHLPIVADYQQVARANELRSFIGRLVRKSTPAISTRAILCGLLDQVGGSLVLAPSSTDSRLTPLLVALSHFSTDFSTCYPCAGCCCWTWSSMPWSPSPTTARCAPLRTCAAPSTSPRSSCATRRRAATRAAAWRRPTNPCRGARRMVRTRRHSATWCAAPTLCSC